MRIIQITDLHVGKEGEETRGIDVRDNFLRIKEEIIRLRPDHLVISGDLCFRSGDKEVYNWIRSHLDSLPIPYDLISGNHDDPVLLAEAFDRSDLLKNNELYFSRTINDQPFLFLDTTTGIVSETQRSWLAEQLTGNAQPMVIFMHHPPLLGGVPFMDSKHSLRNRTEIQQILFNYLHPINIFTGHYHVEKTIHTRNILVHITPSCYFQIDQDSEEFRVDHHRIGLRDIQIDADTIKHTVRYL